ncbi:hypothetical protein AGLY_016854 [Aphis glycines]|uniref:Uncharacterized protein n=1 Tax=Aphis glycines TaxID=307491 RepID=A0A6G0SXC5_APHGL|nr:hypothetical protein AGLY_016854 [Aphis glycines]
MYSYNFLITIIITYEELCIKFSRFLVIQIFFTDTSKKNSHKNRKFQWSINNLKKFLNYNHKKKSIWSKTEQFRSEMGLLVDIVLQGCGTTNNGNTARKFFKNAEKSLEITGLNIDLIKRFGTILIVMASGYEINTDAFIKRMIFKQLNCLLNSIPGTICLHLYIKFCFMELMLSDMQFYQLANCLKKLKNAKTKIIKTKGNITPENYPECKLMKISLTCC